MKLRHYPRVDPFKFDPEWNYDGFARGNGKPEGFWVSVLGEYDWASFVRTEYTSNKESLDRAHEVVLAETANILVVDSHEGLLDLDRELHGSWHDGRYRAPWDADWTKVYGKYDGVIIAPYRWEFRMELNWYYGWDCASGCIWNLRAIAEVRPINENEMEKSDA